MLHGAMKNARTAALVVASTTATTQRSLHLIPTVDTAAHTQALDFSGIREALEGFSIGFCSGSTGTSYVLMLLIVRVDYSCGYLKREKAVEILERKGLYIAFAP